MRKTLLFCLAFVALLAAKAQETVLPETATQKFTLKGEVGTEVSITLGVYANSDVYAVDFGDGVQMIDSVGNQNGGIKGDDGKTKEGTKYTSATKFKGTVAGDGTIKVYGTSDLWYLLCSGGACPTAFDQAGLAKVVQMSITGANVESVVLPAYESMTQFSFNNSALKSIDVSKVTTLTNLTINNTTASKFEPQLESIDVTNNTELTYLSLQGNNKASGKLASIDLTKNTKLESVFVQYNALKEVKLADAYEKLKIFNGQNNELTAFDVTKTLAIKSLYLSDNKLAGDMDVTAIEKFDYLQLNNNELTSVKVNNVAKQFYINDNRIALAALPAQPAGLSSKSKTKQYMYVPQAALEVTGLIMVNGELDLTSQLTVEQGELDPADYATYLSGTTTYGFVTTGGTALVEGTDYQVVEPGKFQFLKEQKEKVYAVMQNTAFPKFTAEKPFTTSNINVASTPILTFTAPFDEEVSLTFGVYDSEDTFGVDFGDGNVQIEKVGIDNKGPVREDGTTGSATKFTGKVAGNGVIKVYGSNDVWYLLASGGALPTSFSQAKLMNVVQMGITGSNIENVSLPEYTKMTQFSFNNSSLKGIDVSKVTTLTSLTINNTTASKFEPQLERIDVSKNTELTYLSLQGNNKAFGKLTEIDLTNNTKLESVFLQYNALTDVMLADAYGKLSILNAQDNQLTAFDASKTQAMKSLYLANNKLTAIDVSQCAKMAWLDLKNNQLSGDLDLSANAKFTNVYVNDNQLTSVKVSNVTKQFHMQNNKMTFATLPAQPAGLKSASKTKQFKYAPQAAFQVAETVAELDLTSQLVVEQGEFDPADYATYLTGTTTYGFVTAGGTALVEGTDYQVVEPGKFRFLTAQTEKVHGVMTNTALPKFDGDDAFVTTEFTVSTTEGIQDVRQNAAAARVYNLQGVEVKQPVKGLYIQNGKKMMVK